MFLFTYSELVGRQIFHCIDFIHSGKSIHQLCLNNSKKSRSWYGAN